MSSTPPTSINVSVRGFAGFYKSVRLAYGIGRRIQPALNTILDAPERVALGAVLDALEVFLNLAPYPFQTVVAQQIAQSEGYASVTVGGVTYTPNAQQGD